MLMCRSGVIVLMLIGALASGCSSLRPQYWYLHNEANHTLMQKVEADWAAFKDSEAGLWTALMRNQEKIAEAEILAQQALNAGVVQTSHVLVLSMTWEEVIDSAQEIQKNLSKDQEDYTTKRKVALDRLSELNSTIKKITADQVQEAIQIEAARKHQNRWTAKLHLIRRGVEEVLERKVKKERGIKNDDGSEVQDDPAKILEEILQEKIEVEGKDGGREKVTLDSALEGDRDRQFIERIFKLRRDPQEWGKFLREVYRGTPPMGFEAPPGIDAEILMLGADLARAELDSAKVAVAMIRELDQLDPKNTPTLKMVKELIGDLRDLKESNARIMKAEMRDSINQSLQMQTTRHTQELINVLTRFVLAADYHELNKHQFRIRLAILEHKYELRQSAVAARQREALLERGIKSLSVYHAGGITQEEIAQILRAAQAVAVWLIAQDIAL